MHAVAMAMILTSDHKEEKQSRNTVIKSKRCNSNSSIDDLTDELLVEILQRVPCKSVLRCKSVSKRWFALISDPYFIHRYCSNKKWRPRKFVLNIHLWELLITSQHPEVCFPLNLSFLPCFETSQVVGSSNGLLLCCCTDKTDKKIYYVCNPFTKQWTVLPPAPRTSYPFLMKIGFISYPSHDYSQCSFKVVRLTGGNHADTFSSETGQWKDLVLSCYNLFGLCRTAIAYNGMLHWVMNREKKIFVYDPANDKFHAIIDGPEDLYPRCIWDFLGLWRGRMRTAQLFGHNFREYYNLKVWELEGYTTGKWRLVHQINLKELTWKDNISPLPPTIPCNLLAFHPSEDVMYLRFKDRVVSCNLQKKTLKFTGKLPKIGKYKNHYDLCGVYTLVLPPWPTPVPALPHDALMK